MRSNQSESIAITNEKVCPSWGNTDHGRRSRRIRLVGRFPAQAYRSNQHTLSFFVFGLRTQLADRTDWVTRSARTTRPRPRTDYIDSHVAGTSAEDLEEKLAEVQAVANFITAKLYQSGAPPRGGESGAGGDEEHVHDEL
jgi:endoplasmic reticulum chaperone BiP